MSVRSNRGFTLFEIMVVLAIVGIVMAAGLPGLQELLRKSRMNAMGNDIETSLAAARALAVTQRRQVFLIAGNPSLAAAPTGTINGWKIVADNSAGVVIEDHQVTAPVTVQLIADVGTNPPSKILFTSTGQVKRNDTGALVNMTYRICDSSITTEVGRDVLMNKLGRVFAKQHANKNCVP